MEYQLKSLNLFYNQGILLEGIKSMSFPISKLRKLMLVGIFSKKLFNVWSLIRSCWLGKNLQLNTRVDMLIRATRVDS